MRKLHKKLLKEQKERNVIFSSQLIPNGRLYEVTEDREDKEKVIERLKNDKFFKGIYKFNEIRT